MPRGLYFGLATILTVAAVSTFAVTGPASADTPGPKTYSNTTVVSTSLPLRYTSTATTKIYNPRVVGKISVSLVQGQVALVYGRGEASTPTNPKLGYLAMHASYLKQTNNGSADANEGVMLDRAMTTNVDDTQHHSTLTNFGAFEAPADGTYTFVYCQYAASLRSSVDTQSLIVNYVQMRVVTL